MNVIQAAYNNFQEKSQSKSLMLMIKLQGTDKLQHYFENSSWCVLETILKLTLLVLIVKFIKTYRSILKYQYMIPSLVNLNIYAKLG